MNSHLSQDTSGDILIIDDTPDNLRVLSNLLTKAGYSIRKVISGELGIEAAQLEPPELILLDIMMPGMNGYEVCERLKLSDRTQDIPVIFLSALDEELDKVQAFQIGGVDYITKPFQVVEVLARIETHLKISRLQTQLLQKNDQLQREITYRNSAENALQILNQGLEARIQERTADLQSKTDRLLKLQSELQTALQQEQHLSQRKSQLIATLAQELRPPMTLIKSAIGLPAYETRIGSHIQPPLNLSHSHWQLIAESLNQMDQVLQDTLLLSDLDTHSSLFHSTPLDLVQFCRSLVQQWQLPEVPHYRLSFVTWGKALGKVLIDETLLRQTLSHLLTNAVHYSPKGGNILFELVYEPTQVILRIHDEGIGIPPAEIDRIFDRFYRASNANQISGKPGPGLGLAVVKQVVELHSGTVVVDSELGIGTTVTIKLPVQNP
jgi:signal transduction histidine kinase